jgi:hypothetical protein
MACDVCLGRNSEKCPVCGKRPEKMVCPECRGYGMVDCTAYKVLDDDGEIDVTPATFVALPETEEAALAQHKKYYKGDYSCCPVCCGCGEVYEESEGEYYPAK